MKKGKLKLPSDPRRKKQVKTFVAKYGRKGYAVAGSRDGRPSPASFTSETARAASLKYWEERRKKEQEKQDHERQSTNEEK